MHFTASVPYESALAAARAFRSGDTVTALDETLWSIGCLNVLRAAGGSGWNQGPQAVIADTISDEELSTSVEEQFAPPPAGAEAAGMGTGLMMLVLKTLLQRLLAKTELTA